MSASGLVQIIVAGLLFGLWACHNEDSVIVQRQPWNFYAAAQRHSDYSATVEAFQTSFFIPHDLDSNRDYRVQDDEGIVLPPLVLGPNEIVLVTAGGTILCVRDDRLVWQRSLSARPAVPMVSDGRGLLYCVTIDGVLVALNRAGEVQWRRHFQSLDTAQWYGIPLSLPSAIIVHSYTGRIVAFTSDGKKQWTYQTAAALLPVGAADRQRRLYYGVTCRQYGATDTILSLDTTGQLRWKLPVDGVRLVKGLVVRDSLGYAVGVEVRGRKRIPVLVCWSLAEGKLRWKQSLPVLARGIAVDAQQTVIVAGYNTTLGRPYSAVLAIHNREVQWQRSIEGKIDTPPLIAQENIAVVLHFDTHAAIVILDRRNGQIRQYAALDELPLLHLFPVVDPAAGNLIFGIRELTGWIEIGEPWIYRILPY